MEEGKRKMKEARRRCGPLAGRSRPDPALATTTKKTGSPAFLLPSSILHAADKTLGGTFEANLTLLPGAEGEPLR
jgi:hypothetical protein